MAAHAELVESCLLVELTGAGAQLGNYRGFEGASVSREDEGCACRGARVRRRDVVFDIQDELRVGTELAILQLRGRRQR